MYIMYNFEILKFCNISICKEDHFDRATIFSMIFNWIYLLLIRWEVYKRCTEEVDNLASKFGETFEGVMKIVVEEIFCGWKQKDSIC